MGAARRVWRGALAGLWLGCIATASCNGRHLSGAPGGHGCKTYNACAILSASDVTAATGSRFDAGMENDPTGTVANASAEIATCTYDTGRAADPFVAILVSCCPCGDNDPY
jgi:hypothetical protein